MTRERFPCPLKWRHNGRDGVSNHQPHHCLLNRLFERRSGNSPVTGEFPAQMASNAKNVFIWCSDILWGKSAVHRQITYTKDQKWSLIYYSLYMLLTQSTSYRWLRLPCGLCVGTAMQLRNFRILQTWCLSIAYCQTCDDVISLLLTSGKCVDQCAFPMSCIHEDRVIALY